MAVYTKFLIFQCIIVCGFGAGYFFKQYLSEKIKRIILFNLIVFEPIIILNSTWGMDIGPELAVLPLTGFAIVLAGFLIGRIISPMLFPDKIRQTTFTLSSSLSNQGFTMGAFICYMLLGQKGLSLAIIFILYFTFYAFGFIFSYASIVRYKHPVNMRFLLKHIFQLRNMPLFMTIISLILTALGISRPVETLNIDPVIYVTIFGYFASLGTQFEFKNVMRLIRPSIYLSLIKFVILPVLVFLFFYLTQINLAKEIRLVIFIESLMPVAVFSVVASSLYDLDQKMSSALFMTNTLIFLIVVLPLLVMGFNYIEPII